MRAAGSSWPSRRVDGASLFDVPRERVLTEPPDCSFARRRPYP